jgi:uncharacterized protein YbjQ (UPF0145 family)
MNAAMTTTAFTLEGFHVARTLGVVRGITVRSRSIVGTVGGALQTLVGGNITLFTELAAMLQARLEADRKMLQEMSGAG